MNDDMSLDQMTMDAAPNLTLNPFEETQKNDVQKVEAAEIVKPDPVFDESTLTPDEKKMVDDFAKSIDLTDSNQILQYGAGAQQKIANFSDTALSKVKTSDLGEISNLLSGMVVELKKFDVDEKQDKGFMGLFKRGSNKIESMKARYASAETNINKICDVMEGHEIQLMKDIAMLDKLYDLNKNYFKELSMYILAGKKKLAQAQNVELPELVEKSQRTGLPEDAQAANDFANLCNRFEKKLHDLELTRTVCMQMAPQIRLVQNNDTLMAEKIRSSLVNTIPLWKSQMVLALGVANATEAAKAQREVTDMTNELLRKNAETLKLNTIETAKASERGVVDIETLKKTNEALISSFDEVLRIQSEGRQKRQDAEIEMQRIENELKQKLLEVSQRKNY